MGGVKTITVTASNEAGTVSDTHTITITMYVPPGDVTISGPTAGLANTAYTFSATVSPPTATAPISYTWSPASDSGQGTSSASYTWATEGVKTITVTAANAGGAVSDTHVITITGLTVRVITYEYDALGRLVGADYTSTLLSAGSTGERFEYRYDKVGNRLRYTQTITGTTVITYVYDAANRLTSVNGVKYSWDNNGNLINDGTRVYTYTQANRLVAISGPGLEWGAMYNADGARLQQTANGTTTNYIQDLAAALPVVLQAQNATRNTQYVFGTGTRPLAQYNGSAWAYLLPDGLGSVRQETGASGNLLATRSFDPYGAPLEGDGGAPYGYTGEEYNGSTELVFLRARYYDPVTGRLLSRDPVVGQHPYAYAANNPINRVDPSGYLSEEIIKNSVGHSLASAFAMSDWGELQYPTTLEWPRQSFSGLLMALKFAKPGNRLRSAQLVRDGDGLKVEWTQEWTIGCACNSKCKPEIALSRGRGWLGDLIFGPETKSFRDYLDGLIKAQNTTYLGGYVYHELPGATVVLRDGMSIVPDLLTSDKGVSFPLPPDPGLPPLDPGYVWSSSVDRYGSVYRSAGYGASFGLPATFAKGAGYMGLYAGQVSIASSNTERVPPDSESLEGYWTGWSTAGTMAGFHGWAWARADLDGQMFSVFSFGPLNIALGGARVYTEKVEDKRAPGWDNIEASLGRVSGFTWAEAVNFPTSFDDECACR